MAKIFSVSDDNSRVEDSSSSRSENNPTALASLARRKGGGKERLEIDFSPRLMLFIILLLAGIFYANQLLLIGMFLFFGFAVMSSIRPIVGWLMERSIPKGWSVTISYIILFLLIQAVFVLVLVPFLNQVSSLVSVFPTWIDKALRYVESINIGGFSLETDLINQYIPDLIKSFPTANNVKNVAGFLSNFFSTGAFLLSSIVFSIYLVSEHDSFFDILLIRIVSDEKRERVKKLVLDVEKKLGSWVLGQAVVSTLVSTFSVILLTILGVPFAFPLSIFTGFLGVIPSLGSTLSSIVIALVALVTVGPIKAVILLVAFVIYQMIENTLIIPKVMGNAVGLKPVIVMLGVIIFLTLFGVVGGFVAVPLMVIMKILYEFYIDLQKLKAKGIV
jgi:predicted PurR-regulated permease PerM